MVLKNTKGAQGIGTLIIFIAMILVAAVAAGVLIQTASSLQSKSLDVGRQSQEKITTDIEVVQVYATDTSDGTINGTGIDTVTMVVRLGSGSAPIKLSDLLIKMDTRAGSQTLNATNVAASQISYNVSYISGGGNAVADGYLSTGDLAEINFLNANDVREGETATIRLLTKNGAVKPVDLTTPSAMTQSTTYLFP
jgi:archaeal flagellin FlaB